MTLGSSGKHFPEAVGALPETTSQPPYCCVSSKGRREAVEAAPGPAEASETTSREAITSGKWSEENVSSRPADGCWPWYVKERVDRGEVYGPDGKYRGTMSIEKARALVQELNGLDPRVDHAAYAAWRASR